MFKILRGLLGGLARVLMRSARMTIMLPVEIGESLFTAVWRQLFPPPVEAGESTASVLREVATMIAGQSGAAQAQAAAERPGPKPASAATVRRRMERALSYTSAIMTGDRLPSLDHVGAELAHELRKLRHPADAEPMHREIMAALGMDADGWVRPRREVVLPEPDPDDGGLTPCPT